MTAFQTFLINLVLPGLEQAGQTFLVQALQKFHDEKPELYKASIVAGYVFTKPLLDYVKQSETKIDDGFVEAISEAIVMSASTNGIDLEALSAVLEEQIATAQQQAAAQVVNVPTTPESETTEQK